MSEISVTGLATGYELKMGGEFLTSFYEVYEEFINRLNGVNEIVVAMNDPMEAPSWILPYMAEYAGIEWDPQMTEDQLRFELMVFVERDRRRGSVWSLEDYARRKGLELIHESLIHKVFELDRSKNDSDHAMSSKEEYHEGSIRITITEQSRIASGLSKEQIAKDLSKHTQAGVHRHIVYK